ncbi:MAG: TIGR01777 family oxidoreductase [Thermodesulfobacteriota bacterium]
MNTDTFTRQSIIDTDARTLFAWHARPGAIERLSPPWDPLEVVFRTGGIEAGARVVLKMAAGPFRYRWHARHTVYEENRKFVDEQVKGPMAFWRHTHAFEPAGENRCRLIDTIDYRLPFHSFTRFPGKALVEHKLSRIFAWRHRVTAFDVALHRRFAGKPPMTVLISGASGVLASALIPLLTTGGHRVIRLVRRKPAAQNEVFWNPAQNAIDTDALKNYSIDAVIHLAGEHVGTGRWTAAKKKTIIDSREKGTRLLAETAARLSPMPRVFLCASATGFYGERGDIVLKENDRPGNDFLAEVCKIWEASVGPAVDAGIRTVRMRIGVVLTPAGGALQRLLPPFQLGLGGRLGSGRQYLSWLSVDDAIGAIFHLLMNDTVSGPVNVVSPCPVTNAEFTRTLARVLSRPALLPVPAKAIDLAFGEMGTTVLLTSTRVAPEKLVGTGYRFGWPDLENALGHILGKTI